MIVGIESKRVVITKPCDAYSDLCWSNMGDEIHGLTRSVILVDHLLDRLVCSGLPRYFAASPVPLCLSSWQPLMSTSSHSRPPFACHSSLETLTSPRYG